MTEKRIYEQSWDGVWFKPVHTNFLEACCDCGSVHHVDFKIIKGNIEMRYTHDSELTYLNRKQDKKVQRRIKKILKGD